MGEGGAGRGWERVGEEVKDRRGRGREGDGRGRGREGDGRGRI